MTANALLPCGTESARRRHAAHGQNCRVCAVAPPEVSLPGRISGDTARVLCQGPPSDYWLLGDDGNRLALMLCDVCPRRLGATCNAGLPDPNPHGVIRAAVAYSEAGAPLPRCVCGYPQTEYRGGDVGLCSRCTVLPDIAIPPKDAVLARRIRLLVADGATDTQIGVALGVGVGGGKKARLRCGIKRPHGRSSKARAAA